MSKIDREQIASLTAEVERARETIDILEANARQQAFLLADTGRRAESAQAQIERLRAALTALSLDLASAARVYPGAAGSAFKSAASFARATLQSTEGDGEFGEPR